MLSDRRFSERHSRPSCGRRPPPSPRFPCRRAHALEGPPLAPRPARGKKKPLPLSGAWLCWQKTNAGPRAPTSPLELFPRVLPGGEQRGFDTASHAQLAEYVRHVVLDRLLRQMHTLSARAIGQAFAHQVQDLPLALRELA